MSISTGPMPQFLIKAEMLCHCPCHSINEGHR
jgi:hypothetical protein